MEDIPRINRSGDLVGIGYLEPLKCNDIVIWSSSVDPSTIIEIMDGDDVRLGFIQKLRYFCEIRLYMAEEGLKSKDVIALSVFSKCEINGKNARIFMAGLSYFTVSEVSGSVVRAISNTSVDLQDKPYVYLLNYSR